MSWILIVLIFLAAGAFMFLAIQYSPTEDSYHQTVHERIRAEPGDLGVFTSEDLEGLPAAVRKYFYYCGYVGCPKMTHMQAYFSDVDFVMSENKTIKINYKQFNSTLRPERFAYISSSLACIPFEGLDFFGDGKGSMRGVLGKVIPLFNQQGLNMDRACLVTWLAECLLVPTAALQEFIRWEEIDETHVQATVSWGELSVGGLFSFSDSGELLSFRTSDRTAVDMDGKETHADWSALFSEYRVMNGLMQPTVLESVWHYNTGDITYFNKNKSKVSICYQ